MEEKILTPDQVAQMLQIHPFTVLKFIKQGKLKASKLGRVYRIRESDVELFLENQATATKPIAAQRASKKSETKTSSEKKMVSQGMEPLLQREEKPLHPSEEQSDKSIELSVKSLPTIKDPSLDPLLLGSESQEEALLDQAHPDKKTSTRTQSNNDQQPFDHYILD